MLWLVQLSPWWSIIHYLMQSATILLIELDFCVKFDIDEVAKITLMVQKSYGVASCNGCRQPSGSTSLGGLP